MEDSIRKLNELALSAARLRVREQTGFVHYNYTAQICKNLKDEVHDTIPVLENFYYALALLRTRTADHIAEGKKLIERLLPFQDSLSGNFPVYLHDYPLCRDWYQAARLMGPFYWIQHHFHSVLGHDLKLALEKATHSLLSYNLKLLDEKAAQEKKIPDFYKILIGAGLKAFGTYFNNNSYKQTGDNLLGSFGKDSSHLDFGRLDFVPHSLGELLAALQMVHPHLSQGPWSSFWHHLLESWHTGTCSYVGPAFDEYQQGFEPQVTLFDLYMGCFTGRYSNRALEDHPCHMQAVLIQENGEKTQPLSLPLKREGKIDGALWHMEQHDKYAFSFFDRTLPFNPAQDKGVSPFKLLWGNEKQVNSLVLQGGNSSQVHVKNDENGVNLDFTLDGAVELEDREKCREIAFYFNITESAKFLIDAIPATTFKMGETANFESEGFAFSVAFEILEGEGQFLGHIMRGNRLSQLQNKGNHRFEAYDWQIYLRTIRRSETCKIRAKISFK